MTATPPETLTHDIEWFAKQIGMKVTWCRRNIKSLPHHKYGGRVHFTQENVETFLSQTYQSPTENPNPLPQPDLVQEALKSLPRGGVRLTPRSARAHGINRGAA